MDPAKVAGITTWPTPTSVKQVRSFLGFCNFYRPFIYQFSHIARPLNELTRKDTPWTWGERQQEAFETLRKRITSEPVLKQPQLEQQFEVEVDASGYAIGAVLMQRDEQGKRHPVAYFSSTLNEAECYDRTSFYYTDTSDCIVSYLSLPYTEAHVRYDLAVPTCTIRSCSSYLYDTILLIIRYTISISEPHILRYLVLGEFRSLST